MFSTLAQEPPSKSTFWAISLFCLSYLIFQVIYIPHLALSVDEFWFAHHIYEYTHKLPYRDFLPYKTVLGYYLFSFPLFFFHSLLEPLYYIKDEIALVNTLFLVGTSFWLTRFFNARAVFYTILLTLLGSHHLLIYSVDLRVDMLTAWLGCLSILLILSNRFALAGFILSASFLVSQKALWFFAATNFAFFGYWLVMSRHWQTIRHAIVFNAAFLFPLFIYILFWSMQSSLSVVLNNVFYEGFLQSKITWYSQVYFACWNAILSNGPLLAMLWPLTWVSLFIRTRHDELIYQRRFFITLYTTIMMLCIVSYQQAFPYGMVFIIPVYFLLYSDFFSWLMTISQQEFSLKFLNQRALFWFLTLYTFVLFSLIVYMMLPFYYYLMILMPICLGSILLFPQSKNILKAPILIIIICTGMIYPVLRLAYKAYLYDNTYQKAMLITSDKLLQEGGGFFAGTPLFYNRDQAIPGLRNLIGPAVEYLSNPSPQLLPMMLSSLYLEPRTMNDVIHDLKVTPVKFYVNNYRVHGLPDPIRDYLRSEFDHYWGSIYIYAPKITAKKQTVFIKFSGSYKVIAKQNASIYLDNQKRVPGSVVSLTQGKHLSKTNYSYRLKYMPNDSVLLDPKYTEDDWYSLVREIVI